MAKKHISKINKILENILDIKLFSLRNPFEQEGTLYFEKGLSKKLPFENLSSGEKEVIDLILDLIIKTEKFNNTIFCIDEPELHINTAIQRKLLIEIEKLIPESCQLWIGTHSIGFLRALQGELKDKTQVIDMGNSDFDKNICLTPIVGTRTDWQRIFKTALDDLTGLIAPKKIIYCEGKHEAGENGEEQGIDAQVYNIIFEKEFNDVLFISSGGNNEPRVYSDVALSILQKAFLDTKIFILKDRGGKEHNKKDEQRDKFLAANNKNRMLRRRELENYLFDPEVLQSYKSDINVDEIYEKEFDFKYEYLKPKYQQIKQSLSFNGGMNKLMLELAKKITSDTAVYHELKKCIFPETET